MEISISCKIFKIICRIRREYNTEIIIHVVLPIARNIPNDVVYSYFNLDTLHSIKLTT